MFEKLKAMFRDESETTEDDLFKRGQAVRILVAGKTEPGWRIVSDPFLNTNGQKALTIERAGKIQEITWDELKKANLYNGGAKKP